MNEPLIGIVGPCAAGKTTLVARLERDGYRVRHIAQEHSYVAYMWERITAPQILIYLQVSYALTLGRRKLNWTVKEYEEQLFRLRHARQHAQLVIDTDALSTEQVYQLVIDFLQSYRE
jgi:nicotinamide riboside kinase